MNFAVRYSAFAKNSVTEHVRWWSDNRSAAEASHWLGVVDSIASDPTRFPEAAESGFDGRVLREALVRPGRTVTHRVVFEVEGETVFLLQIRHVRMDGPSRDELTFRD